MSESGSPAVSNDAVKIGIKLTEAQLSSFPADAEHMWFSEENGAFRLKNIPFLVDELSFEDLVSLVEVEPGYFQIGEILHPSANSTVWLYTKKGAEGREVLDAISNLGCGVEGGLFDGYYAINVPGTVDFAEVMEIVTPALERETIMVDYPSYRHPD